MNPELERKIQALEEVLQALRHANSIPFDIDQAFRERLGVGDISALQVDGKIANSENQAVNEAGSASYQVLAGPDGWLSLEIGGTTYVIPHYGSS